MTLLSDFTSIIKFDNYPGMNFFRLNKFLLISIMFFYFFFVSCSKAESNSSDSKKILNNKINQNKMNELQNQKAANKIETKNTNVNENEEKQINNNVVEKNHIELPKGVIDLPIKGYNSSTYVAPNTSEPPPWKIIVILHGNFDRPEWECEWWQNIAGKYGWLLCPRGIPRNDIPKNLDRWTYSGWLRTSNEINNGVERLKEIYPDMIKEENFIYIGFSLGAAMAAKIVNNGRYNYEYIIFGEDGYNVSYESMKKLASKGIKKVAYLCGEKTGCKFRSKRLEPLWNKANIPIKIFVMPGAGHGYNDDFDTIAEKVFNWLLLTN